MIAPRLFVTYKGVKYAIEQRGEAWAIGVAGGWYFLTANDEPSAAADRFIRARLSAPNTPHRPGFLASQRYPLLLRIDAAWVRAWPGFVPRGRGSPTYVQPALGRRVATTRGPVWLFAARGREISAGGDANPEQDVGDVAALARAWVSVAEPQI